MIYILTILTTIALVIIVYLFLPDDEPSCRKHGTASMYRHGYYDEWDCEKCRKEANKKKIKVGVRPEPLTDRNIELYNFIKTGKTFREAGEKYNISFSRAHQIFKKHERIENEARK